jgi:hypothetical protein
MNCIAATTMHAKNAATTKRVMTASRKESSGSLLGAGTGGVQENRGAAPESGCDPTLVEP